MKSTIDELTLRIASEPWELEQIHRLNHRTFVEEIPQHAPSADGRLVDRFHAENAYVVAERGRTVVGMLALRKRRPFSLDSKMPGLDRHLPPGCRPIEVRLLAVLPELRHRAVFIALFGHAVRACLDEGFDVAVISGTTRQLKLYRHLGFVPFGPRVGNPGALYQPMYLTLEAFSRTVERSAALRDALGGRPLESRPWNLLPGPVATAPEVDRALAAPAISHRSPEFRERLAALRGRLRELTGAREVQVLPGSGSLGTSVVAAQLGLRPERGLVLSNGEFGERLAAEARRARLPFEWLRLRWGEVFDLSHVRTLAAGVPRGGWLWFVHHETSTGVLNPLAGMKAIAGETGSRLCVDCISSLGAVPVDLRGVHLATATSGKGLGGHPGLALVFHDSTPRPEPEALPCYLDLGHWAAHESSPYTHSSQLVDALLAAVERVSPERIRRIGEDAAWLRAALRARGFALVAPEDAACPAIVTIALDSRWSAAELGDELERRGFWLNFRSGHLLERNWIQISLLGGPPRKALEHLVHALESIRCGNGSSDGVLPSASVGTS